MSKRIPAKLKAELGELLASWYRKWGMVATRRPYHEDDSGGDAGTASNKMFEDHPLFVDMPIGAPSDLASILIEDSRTLDEVNIRKDELTQELQNKLTLALNQKLQNRKRYEHQMNLTPY